MSRLVSTLMDSTGTSIICIETRAWRNRSLHFSSAERANGEGVSGEMSRSTVSAIDDNAAIAVNSLATDARTITGSQEYDTSRDLRWLSRSSHGAGEVLLRLVVHRCWDKGRPDWFDNSLPLAIHFEQILRPDF
jgi:hypothetical protein